MDSRAAIRAGGDSGKAIAPGDAKNSLLIKALGHADDNLKMPPDKKLSSAIITDFEQWVKNGAAMPIDYGADKAIAKSDHWSFQPVTRPVVPKVKNAAWMQNEIDAFILHRLEKENATPSPKAEPRALIRRLSLDLTGLPPTPKQVGDFVNDKNAEAYERLVDQLLSSQHFGERWGRHWLDLARYADSDGYEMDHPRPHAFRFRDWVIDAINRDMPFDQFTIEQLAGDLLPNATWEQKIATGFHRNTPTNRENGIDKEEFRIKAVIDRVNTTGVVWLGLTVGCAQCHTHKYDPITQREYYQLFAFFNDRCDEHDLLIPAGVQFFGRKMKGGIAQAITHRSNVRQSHVHLRGDFLKKGPRVDADLLSIISKIKHEENKPLTRLDLAQWIVDSKNPLTPRVEVNRIWQHLFGVGIVESTEDFGTQGTKPTHPKLLDWLSSESIARKWSRKAMIKLIVSSATYQQTSRFRKGMTSRDPKNHWLARQNRIRLSAEIIRDQYLAASGLLKHHIGGPSFRPPLPKGMSSIGFRFKWPVDKGASLYRRGMYIFFQRNLLMPVLQTFDHPDGIVTCTRRKRSNTPLQALTQLNAPIFVESARALAKHVIDDKKTSRDRIALAFRRCLCREPNVDEMGVLSKLFSRFEMIYERDEKSATALCANQVVKGTPRHRFAAMIAVCRTIMNLDEFITRE